MADKVLDIDGIIANFNTWNTAETNRATAQSNYDGLGDKPDLPSFVDNVAEDYTAQTDARATWETNKQTYLDQIASYTSQKAAAEALLLEKLVPNMWLQIDADTGGGTDYHWIGYNTNDAVGYEIYLRHQAGATQPSTPLTHNMDA